jgi:hypothetical protein
MCAVLVALWGMSPAMAAAQDTPASSPPDVTIAPRSSSQVAAEACIKFLAHVKSVQAARDRANAAKKARW